MAYAPLNRPGKCVSRNRPGNKRQLCLPGARVRVEMPTHTPTMLKPSALSTLNLKPCTHPRSTGAWTCHFGGIPPRAWAPHRFKKRLLRKALKLFSVGGPEDLLQVKTPAWT